VSKQDCLAAALVVLLALPLSTRSVAQAAAPAGDAEAEAAAKAAMERAKRLAEGPMRRILEASKSRRRAAEPEPAADAEAVTVRSVAGRAATETQAVAEPPRVETQITLVSAALQNSASPGLVLVNNLNRVAAAVPAPAIAAVRSWSVPALPEVALAPPRPHLLKQINPELPQRALDELGRNAVVTVDLTIRMDGTVSDVAIVGQQPRPVRSAVLYALEQWRFSPLPRETLHRVELVFNVE
jgi:hypothetical protein